MTVRLIPLASDISNKSDVTKVTETVKNTLGGVQTEFSDPVTDEQEAARAAEGRHAIALMVTGGTEHLARAAFKSSQSLLLLYHDSLNSLPAALEAASLLSVPVARFDDVKQIRAYISASNAHEKIAKSKFLYFGEPSPWLIYSKPSDADLERIGLKVKRVKMEEFTKRVKEEKVNERELRKAVQAAEALGPSQDDFVTSLKIESAIREELKEHNSSIFSIRCFDLLGPLKGTACLALSRLNDEGYTAGCEGDAPAAISMNLLSSLSGRPSFMGNIARVEGKNVTVAHCTSPTSILSGFKYMTHFESGMGVGIRGSFEEGTAVTVLRMSGDLKVIRYGTAKVVGSEWRSDLCRTQVTLSFEGDPSLIIRNPIGNHYSLTPGNYSQEIGFLSGMLGAKLERI
ncbi:MAG: hypothetical protein JRN26_02205 [Nitrososphaerota archaeon]|jgi:L-fucose isomerase-like protein|nr:hypothetical protein [Nitrososphaerota archaeon]